MSLILFLIYISRVFNKVSETSSLVTFFSFVNDLGFITLGSSIKEIVKAHEKVVKKVIEWERQNAITYNTSKMEAVLFSRSY